MRRRRRWWWWREGWGMEADEWSRQEGGGEPMRVDEVGWGEGRGGERREGGIDRRETGTVEFKRVQSKWREMKRFRDKNVYNEALWSNKLIQVAHTEALTCLFFLCFSEIEFRCLFFFFSPIPSYNYINKADWTENWPEGGGGGGERRRL